MRNLQRRLVYTIVFSAMAAFLFEVAAFAHTLKISPDNGDARYHAGLALIRNADYARALHELSIAARLEKGDDNAEARIYNAEGIAYYKQDLNIEAQGEFGKALSVDPANIDALYYIGLINYKVNGYAAASRFFDKVIAAGKNDPKTRKIYFRKFYGMGIDFQNRGKSSSAAEMFGEALGLKPYDPETHFYRGRDFMALERYGDAVSEFREALASKPGMAKAGAQLKASVKLAAVEAVKKAGAAFDGRRYYEALKLYRQAASYDPSNGDAEKGMAKSSSLLDAMTQKKSSEVKALIGDGDFAGAKNALAALKKLDPDSDEAKALSVELAAKSSQEIKKLFSEAKQAESAEALSSAEDFYFRILLIEPSNREAAHDEQLMREKISDEWKKENAAEAGRDFALAEKRLEKLAVYTPGDPVVKARIKEVMAGLQKQKDEAPASKKEKP